MPEIASLRIVSHVDSVTRDMETAVERALVKIGIAGEGYAKELCPTDTGRLRNSITNQVSVDDKTVIIGTNTKYAPYVEMGTGKFATDGNGHKVAGSPPWSYMDDKGQWHRTSGAMPQPYIKPAIANHEADYRKILENELKG